MTTVSTIESRAAEAANVVYTAAANGDTTGVPVGYPPCFKRIKITPYNLQDALAALTAAQGDLNQTLSVLANLEAGVVSGIKAHALADAL